MVVLQSEFNDMINPAATAAVRALPLSTRAAANYGQTLQATLALLSSSSRADWSSSRGSRGWVSARGSAYLGGSLIYTTTPGQYREMTVDVGASGTVWLVTWEVSRGMRNPRTGATAAGANKTVNLGTGGAAGSDTVVNIGSDTPGADGVTVINTPTVTFANAVTAVGMPQG